MQATLGLLRICTRLLPYKESSAEALLKSLQLVLRLDPHVAWDLAQQIATELLKLVKTSAAYIRYGMIRACLVMLVRTTCETFSWSFSWICNFATLGAATGAGQQAKGACAQQESLRL